MSAKSSKTSSPNPPITTPLYQTPVVEHRLPPRVLIHSQPVSRSQPQPQPQSIRYISRPPARSILSRINDYHVSYILTFVLMVLMVIDLFLKTTSPAAPYIYGLTTVISLIQTTLLIRERQILTAIFY